MNQEAMSYNRKLRTVLMSSILILSSAVLHLKDKRPFDSKQNQVAIPKSEKEEIQKLRIKLFVAQKGKTWESVKHLHQIPNYNQVVSAELLSKRRELIEELFKTTSRVSISKLITILENKSLDIATRIAAANMLGELRAPKAVDALLRQMTIVVSPISQALVRDPCVDSLVQIGKPASQKALTLLEKEDDIVRVGYLSRVILGVEDKELAIFQLKNKIDQAADQKIIDRLEKAIRIIE